jgi:arylesterase/paraoxonase
LGLARTSVGYCHVDNGCKIAISGLQGSNGIARAQNGTVYVGNSKLGQIRVFEEQNDQSLVLTDIIALGTSMIMFGELSVIHRHSSRVQIVSWTTSPST